MVGQLVHSISDTPNSTLFERLPNLDSGDLEVVHTIRRVLELTEGTEFSSMIDRSALASQVAKHLVKRASASNLSLEQKLESIHLIHSILLLGEGFDGPMQEFNRSIGCSVLEEAMGNVKNPLAGEFIENHVYLLKSLVALVALGKSDDKKVKAVGVEALKVLALSAFKYGEDVDIKALRESVKGAKGALKLWGSFLRPESDFAKKVFGKVLRDHSDGFQGGLFGSHGYRIEAKELVLAYLETRQWSGFREDLVNDLRALALNASERSEYRAKAIELLPHSSLSDFARELADLMCYSRSNDVAEAAAGRLAGAEEAYNYFERFEEAFVRCIDPAQGREICGLKHTLIAHAAGLFFKRWDLVERLTDFVLNESAQGTSSGQVKLPRVLGAGGPKVCEIVGYLANASRLPGMGLTKISKALASIFLGVVPMQETVYSDDYHRAVVALKGILDRPNLVEREAIEMALIGVIRQVKNPSSHKPKIAELLSLMKSDAAKHDIQKIATAGWGTRRGSLKEICKGVAR